MNSYHPVRAIKSNSIVMPKRLGTDRSLVLVLGLAIGLVSLLGCDMGTYSNRLSDPTPSPKANVTGSETKGSETKGSEGDRENRSE